MEYADAAAILNRHIFEGDKQNLLEKVANNPERYTGLFRPTKPKAKLLQNLLQSHEIRFGDAMESLIEAMLADIGFSLLPKNLQSAEGDSLSLDQYFTNGETYFFMEQKVRDDHDSTKKRGQIGNFETKLNLLYEAHGNHLVGMMYFIDPDLSKNKNYYLEELNKLRDFYGIDLYLFYGHEFFEYLGFPHLWDNLIEWLTQWKMDLPDFPEINLDSSPGESFEEIKMMKPLYWRKLLENKQLWEDGIIRVLFSDGATLRLMLAYFSSRQTLAYQNLTRLLNERLVEYYG
ncbi:restriction endonuclease [Candidatus Parcubacteria bacterium]|nr:MAG: restriction endonuclease [Candidatus Parcubacteria bacterium]